MSCHYRIVYINTDWETKGAVSCTYRMLGHVLIAAALVFVLNLTGSTVDFVSSLTPDSQLAVVAGPGTTPRTEPPKKDTCKRGHTYEVVVEGRTGEVSTKD